MLSQVFRTGLLLTASCLAHAAVFDPPNAAVELEMHRQYLRQAGRVQEDAPVLAKDAYLESYNLQRGETLWSLSQILYGDGNYWPKVWAQNNAITNPHLIRPGHQLQFLLGSEDDAPAFRFTEPSEEGGVERTATNGVPVIEIPPPELQPRPVLKIPDSFPEWQSVYKQQVKPLLDDRNLSKKRDPVADRIFLRAWVEEKEIEPIGYFMENDTESGLPVVNQYVFVKIKKGEGHSGQKLTIVHSAGKIRTVQSEFDNDVPAYVVQVAGELEITEGMSSEFLKSRDREEYEAFRAIMTKTTGLSLKGNSLIAGEIQYANLSSNGPHGSATAQVIGSERGVSSMLYGQGDIVFLNRGSQSGVEVGQIFDVYGNRRTRYPDTPVAYSPAPSGRLKVIRVSQGLATALVLRAHDSMAQGDRVQAIIDRPQEVEKLPAIDTTPIQGGILGRPSESESSGAE